MCRTGLVWLGGNGARGCKGAKRGYFVLVHVAHRPAEAAHSPGYTLPQLHRGISSTDYGGGSVSGDSAFLGSAANTPPWVTRERGMSVVSSSRSRSTTLVSDTVAGSVFSEDNDDTSVASTSPYRGNQFLASTRYSAGSRSFGSLHDIAGGGADSGGGAGGLTGDSPGGNPSEYAVSGHRRRGMSTADATFDTSSKIGGPAAAAAAAAGGRARAWTSGQETVWNGGGGTDAATGALGYSPYGVGASNKREGGIQRISALWDTEKDGPLSQIPVPFDRVGRRWSRKFNVDAAKTAGPLETSGATLGVSVSALSGQFHRTRVVTLYPRLVVRNFLGIPLEVYSRIGCVYGRRENVFRECMSMW